jgi:hypothetical protein
MPPLLRRMPPLPRRPLSKRPRSNSLKRTAS